MANYNTYADSAGFKLAHPTGERSRFITKVQHAATISLDRVPEWMSVHPTPVENLAEVSDWYEVTDIAESAMTKEQLRSERQRPKSQAWAERAVAKDQPGLRGVAHAKEVARYAITHHSTHVEYNWAQRNAAVLINTGVGAAAAAAMAGALASTPAATDQWAALKPAASPVEIVIMAGISFATTAGLASIFTSDAELDTRPVNQQLRRYLHHVR